MNDLKSTSNTLEERITQAEMSVRDEVSKLHFHVTEESDRSLRFLQRQFYELKKILFFPGLTLDEAAFNGQFSKHLVWNELKPKLAGSFAVETGTYLGGTTSLLARAFSRVLTIDINAVFQEQAKLKTGDATNVEFILSDSASFLRQNLPKWVDEGCLPEFFYLDAHWDPVCPLAEEVELISRSCHDAIVMIDDIEVPGDAGYGFDRYEKAVLDKNYLSKVVREFGLACFVPRL